MIHILQAPINSIRLVLLHRELTLQLTKHELFYQHSMQVFGGAWAIIHPFCLMLVYSFIFGFIFKTRLNIDGINSSNYTSFILAGLISWMPLQQAIAKSCNNIIGNTNLVKQVVFPVDILPYTSVLYSFFLQIVFISIFFALNIYFKWLDFTIITILMATFAIFLQIGITIGISLFLSATCVYLKDVKEIVQFFLTIFLFILPVLYAPNSTPRIFEVLIYFNPLSYLIWVFQDTFFYGYMHHPFAWFFSSLFCLSILILGSNTFDWLKTWFGEMV